jgi:hypothetical protein
MNDFLAGDYSSAPMPVSMMLIAVLMSFTTGMVVAWVYMLTHSGLSYSRSFVSSLIIIPVVVTLVMMVMSNNLVTAFGLMAVFAMVRFRNILRDTLDTSHILCCIVVGMACGTQKFTTAIVACATTSIIMIFLWWTSFGSRLRYDAVLNLLWDRPIDDIEELTRMLHRHGRSVERTSERAKSDGSTDLSFRLLLRDPARLEDLVKELQPIRGVSRVTVLRAQDESEA